MDGFSWGIVGGIIALIMVVNLLLKSKFLEKFITIDSNTSTLKKNYKKRGKM
jgi:membrane-bound serine protease (ClpP class)